jgi:adenylate kinase
MKLILLGPPGAGKGTVSEGLLQAFPQLIQVSPGQLLREEVRKGTTIGATIKEHMDSGGLVPDQFVVEVVRLEIDGKDNYILDGFPRSSGQAKTIEDLNVDLVINLDISEEEVVERFAGRRIDPVTKKTYHIKNVPPPQEIADRVIQRDDDKPEIVKERFRVYNESTKPLINFYKEKGTLVSVDASSTPAQVIDAVVAVIKQKLNV